ncbi:MAG: hypothetical protein QOD99_3194 [Chthoniobacter sp.]|jgi:glyoxylase-like metal-dependent hydrolase (beta-lactamase superfamily II)|nr:hypothetical protein [Chthoniobacter sp.]
MKAAEELQQIRKDLWFWQAYDPAVKTELCSCALKLDAGLVFIDPIRLDAESMSVLETAAPPLAVMVTNGNHARAAQEFREKFSVPILAHADGVSGLELEVDQVLEDGAAVFGELAAVSLPGFGPGEIALYSARGRGALFLGDALINAGSHGLAPLPSKYCADARVASQSLQKLLQFDFELMTFAHGLPIVTAAKSRVQQLLA